MSEDNNLKNSGENVQEASAVSNTEKPVQGNGLFGIGCILLFAIFIGWGMYKGAVNRDEAKKALAAKGVEISDASVIASVKKGDHETLKQLLTAGANAEAKGDNDSSALIVAVTEGKTDIVKQLLAAKVNVNFRNAQGVSAMIAAADKNNAQIAGMLFNGTVEVNAIDNSGNTALIYAAERANAELVKMLLSKGADLRIKNNKGETALNAAKADNIKEILTAAEKSQGISGVSVPAQAGGTASVQLASPAADIEKLSPAEARKKLEASNVSYNDNRFIEAVSKNETEAVALFIRAGLHPNTKNADGVNSLMAASKEGNVEMMKFLLSKNANVNAKDKNDATALMIAAENSKPDAVKLLIEKGADVTAKDKKGRNALNFAVNEDVKKALSAAGAK
jgi:serine/threonine-protein phosphatase 6 regulatory ankyrin repeat subunit B